MNTLALILLFVMACFVSFKAGISYGQYTLFKALAYIPDEMRNEHFTHYKQEVEKAKKGAE